MTMADTSEISEELAINTAWNEQGNYRYFPSQKKITSSTIPKSNPHLHPQGTLKLIMHKLL
jgi:hypothetical protein